MSNETTLDPQYQVDLSGPENHKDYEINTY